ncbi:ATP-binding cassette domain-containing protein [Paenibacillus sp. P25]|nr:ATP-binding cassette domain-containing protein [Paenibacillus sp. P25]
MARVHPQGERPYLFSDITARLDPQETVAVLGISGQGKTTLLRTLARLETADEGELFLKGISSSQWRPREWRKKVCYVPQRPVMLPGNVEDNLRTVSQLHGRPFERDLARRLMQESGLEGIDWAKPAASLSGGEKQRLQLIRSLLLHPEPLLLDEATSALDAGSRQAVERSLQEWSRREGTAWIWVTHDPEQARGLGGRVWFMAGGTLLEDAATSAFFAGPATEEGRNYLRHAHSGREEADGSHAVREGDAACPS